MGSSISFNVKVGLVDSLEILTLVEEVLRTLVDDDNFYSATYVIPMEAVEKMAPNFDPQTYYNEELDCDCLFYYRKSNGESKLIKTTDMVIYN